jgi:MFS family permease
MDRSRDPLFTPRFFVMCAFTFTVFLSAFMLLPTAPFRIESLGGSRFQAGLFLGFLTFASALSAPFTGALADRFGRRSLLLTTSLVLAGFSAAYGASHSVFVMLCLVPIHGVFWSGLLSTSAAYMTDLIPESRRAEGIGFWGFATIGAIAVAPPTGLWLYRQGWGAVCAAAVGLNLAMTAIATQLRGSGIARSLATSRGPLVEWRVLGLAVTLFLYSFGYGGVTSFVALYAQESGVAFHGVYFTALSIVILATRSVLGPLADRVGPWKVLLPCLLLTTLGIGLLSFGGTLRWLLASACVFGAGFGTAYTAFAAHVLRHVDPGRRGAAFGAMLAAFDTGIGTGSIVTGWIAERAGFGVAFAVAAALAALSAPYFAWAEPRLLRARSAPSS